METRVGYLFGAGIAMKAPSSCIVYTPENLARVMAESLAPSAQDRFLDPCVGRGALTQALARSGVKPSKIRALDLDRKSLATDRFASVLRGKDYLHWSAHTSERFSKIIANPPYLALNRLRGKLKQHAQLVASPFATQPLPMTGNYWHSFLCASLRLLRPGGSICFLLPAAWDYANYSRELREQMPKRFESVRIHRSSTPLFMGLQEGSIVLLAEGFRKTNRLTRRYEHKSLNELVTHLRAGASVRAVQEKRSRAAAGHVVRLEQLVRISIGAVTGDSSFFLMTENQRRGRRIPISACRRVLTRAAHLQSHQISGNEWQALRDQGERVWLFRPSVVSAQKGSVRNYLRRGTERGHCQRQALKIQLRTPWYQTRMPDDADGFMSGMGIGGPWIALNVAAGLSVTNTLYTVNFLDADTLNKRAAVAISLMTSSVRTQLNSVGRRYADGLIKFEPGDLKAVMVPGLRRSAAGAVSAYRRLIKHWLDGEETEAQKLADKWTRDV